MVGMRYAAPECESKITEIGHYSGAVFSADGLGVELYSPPR
jgi:hypothetical protein